MLGPALRILNKVVGMATPRLEDIKLVIDYLGSTEWRGLLSRQPEIARQVLRRLVSGRVDDAGPEGPALHVHRLGRLRCGAERNSYGGAPGVTRTPGTQFRKLLLYPPELRGRKGLPDAAG